MNFFKKISVYIILIFFSYQNYSNAEIPYYVDFKLILNESEAGKKAQNFLKQKLENGIKQIKNKEKKLQDEEKKIIQQKKVISSEDYKKKVTNLRKDVSNLQKDRSQLLDSVANASIEVNKEITGKETIKKSKKKLPLIIEYIITIIIFYSIYFYLPILLKKIKNIIY